MLFFRKKTKIKFAELEGRVVALEDALKKLAQDYAEIDKSINALWNLYKEKMFVKPVVEQKPKSKPKKHRPRKFDGKESPDSAE